MVSFSTVSGGGVSALTGGNFWEGAATAFYVSLLNHSVHQMEGDKDSSNNEIESRYKYKDKFYDSKSELYGAIFVDQAAEQFGIKDIVSLALALDNQGLLNKPFQAVGASKGTSFASKYGAEALPWEMPKRLPTHMRGGTWRYTKVLVDFWNDWQGP